MLVYRITNTVNGKVYIGKTGKAVARQRWQQHVASARRNSPRYLHRAIRKHGPDVFTVEVLHNAKTAVELSRMETFFIILHQSHKPENGYNLTLGGEGVTMTDEIRTKIRVSKLGKKRPPYSREWRLNISRGQRGRHRSPEHCANIASAKLGKPLSAAHCGAIAASNQKYCDVHPELCLDHLAKAQDVLAKLCANDPSFKLKRNAAIKAAWTSEARKIQSAKMSEVRRNTGYVKSVRCIDTGEIFSCLTDVTENVSNLSRAIKHGYLFFGKRWGYVQPVA